MNSIKYLFFNEKKSFIVKLLNWYTSIPFTKYKDIEPSTPLIVFD